MSSLEGRPSPDARELRSFALAVGVALSVVGGVSWFRHRHEAAQLLAWALWVVAGAIALAGLAAPRALGPFHRAWTAVGRALGWANTRLILSIIYFGVMTPIGIILRICRRDVLRIRRRRPETLWVKRDTTRPASQSYPRMF